MNEYLNLTSSDIQQKLTKEKLLPLQIINLAIPFSTLLFLVILFIIYSSATVQDLPKSPVTVEVFYVVGIFIFSILMIHPFIIRIIERQMFNPQKVKAKLSAPMLDKANNEITDVVQKLVQLLLPANVISIAMYESAALAGVVALFIAVNTGVIFLSQSLWVFATPTAIMLLQAAVNYPTKEKVALLIEEKIIKPLKNASLD